MSQDNEFFDFEDDGPVAGKGTCPETAAPDGCGCGCCCGEEAPAAAPAGGDACAEVTPKPAGKLPTALLVVLAMAAALVVGIAIGHFFASNGGSGTQPSAAGSSAQTQVSGTQSAGTSSVEGMEMPSNHPDFSQFYDENGEVDMAKVEAWKAEHADELAKLSGTSVDA